MPEQSGAKVATLCVSSSLSFPILFLGCGVMLSMMNAKIRAHRNNRLYSLHSFDFVKSRGVDAVFNYNTPSA